MVTQRTLKLDDLKAVLAELDRLHKKGYDKLANWDLGQICDHLSYFIEGSLDGHKFKVPWLLKILFGRMVLNRILKSKSMPVGKFTPQKPLPKAGGDDAKAVARLRANIERVVHHQGEFQDSPFFGHLTPEQWRELHLIHCGHHLAFLQPK